MPEHVDPIGNVWPSESAARAAWAAGERDQNRRRAAMSGPAFTISPGREPEPLPDPEPVPGMTEAERAALASAVLIVDAVAAAIDGRTGVPNA